MIIWTNCPAQIQSILHACPLTVSLYLSTISLCAICSRRQLVRLSPGIWEKANVSSCMEHSSQICQAHACMKAYQPFLDWNITTAMVLSLCRVTLLPPVGQPQSPPSYSHYSIECLEVVDRVMLFLYAGWELGVVHLCLTEVATTWSTGIHNDVYMLSVVLIYDLPPAYTW